MHRLVPFYPAADLCNDFRFAASAISNGEAKIALSDSSKTWIAALCQWGRPQPLVEDVGLVVLTRDVPMKSVVR